MNAGTVAFTPGARRGMPGRGFVFPDDEALIQAEFEKTLAFDLGAGQVRRDPANPQSPVGIDVKPFYLDADDIDPQNGQTSLFDFKFNRLLRRSAGGARAGRAQPRRRHPALPDQRRSDLRRARPASGTAATATARRRTYYHVVRGSVTGTGPGDSVEGLVRGRRRSGATRSPTTVGSDSGNRVLVLVGRGLHRRVARDSRRCRRLSTSPTTTMRWPPTASASTSMTSTRTAARRRTHLGVLSHYDAVVWYTGDDVVTREPGWGPATRRDWRCRSCSRSATTSTRVAAVLYTGQARAGSTRRRSAPSSTTRSRTANAAAARPS